jgi:hypothetical protein
MSQTVDKQDNGGMPVWVSILILAASLSFIIWYFVIWPIILRKRGWQMKPDGAINRIKEENA